ncbi:MAG: ABC transporter permease [Acidobacteriota bacterium]|nr:ABC transporter permease [Acidobacteriota bacterium]
MPTPVRRFVARLAAFLRPSRAERGLAREVEAHLALIEDEGRRRGLSGDDARLAARRAFGGVEQAKEQQRDARSFVWLEHLRQDVRYAVRGLARAPGFTLVVVSTLALGIGANTAIFSVVQSVLLKSLPYPDADRLVRLVEHVPAAQSRGGGPGTRPYFTGSDIDALRQVRALSEVAAYNGSVLTMVGPAGATGLEGARVTPSLFPILGATPVLGRLFTNDDVAAGRDHLVLLSYRLWQSAFAADPRIVGRSVGLQALLGRSRAPESYTVVGVMRPGFHLLDPDTQSELWMPLLTAAPRASGFVVGRLSPGASMTAAEAEVAAALNGERGTTAVAVAGGPPRFDLLAARDELVAPVRPALLVLAVAGAFVLLIACVNVANLFLARTMARQPEIGVRMALGAGRWRVVRLLLTESLLLAGLGGAGGIVLAVGGVALLRHLAATLSRIDIAQSLRFPRLHEIAIDGTALVFTAAVALASGVAFGLAAAVRSSAPHRTADLRAGRASAQSGFDVARRLRGRGLLVVAETSMAVMLLVGGGLLIGSFTKLAGIDPGYDPAQTLTFQVALPGYPDARLERFAEVLTARLQGIPGVHAAAAARVLPMVDLKDTSWVGQGPAGSGDNSPVPPGHGADTRLVSAGYFAALGMRMMAGRSWTDDEGPGRRRSVVINEALAQRDWPGRNPVGQSVYVGNGRAPWTIVGVVQDAREFALDQPPEPEVFADVRWIGDFAFPPYPVGPYFIIRTAGDPGRLMGSLRAAVRGFGAGESIINVASLNELLANSLTRPRLYAVWLGIFAAIAVALAAIGIYGVLAYAVEARTREIGIRRALGAQVGHVLGLVLRQSLVLTATGLAIGLAGAAALGRYLQGMLFGLTPLDPTTYVAAAVGFVAVAALATYVPARRASRIDPQVALRSE